MFDKVPPKIVGLEQSRALLPGHDAHSQETDTAGWEQYTPSGRVAVRQGWNLQLSGHTHGGQVTVEIFDRAITPARFSTPYVYGLFRAGASAAYVTRGIGTLGIPVRIGAPPEIAVLRLRKA